MASSHAFMDLDASEFGYFVTQVGLAATSFGVTTEDVTAVATALQELFGYRCSPKATVIPEMGPTLNSICQNEKCPLDPNAQCSAYPNNGLTVAPAMAEVSNTTTPSSTGTVPSATSTDAAMFTGGASVERVTLGVIVGALALAIAL